MGFLMKVLNLIGKCAKFVGGFISTSVKSTFAKPKTAILTIAGGITAVKTIKSAFDEFKLKRHMNAVKKKKEKARAKREETALANFEPNIKPNKDVKNGSFKRFTDAVIAQNAYGGPFRVLTEREEKFLNRYLETEANEAFKAMPKYQQLYLLETMYSNLDEFETHLKEVEKASEKKGLRNYLFYNYNLGAPKYNEGEDEYEYPNPFKETKNHKGFFGKYVVKPIDEMIYRMEVGYNKPDYPEDQFEMFTETELSLIDDTVITKEDFESVRVDWITIDHLVNINEPIMPRDLGAFSKSLKKQLKKANIPTVYISDLKQEIDEFKNRQKKEEAQFTLSKWFDQYKYADGLDARALVTLFTRETLLGKDPYSYNDSVLYSNYKYKDYEDMNKEEQARYKAKRRFGRLLQTVELSRDNKDFDMISNIGELIKNYTADDETILSDDYLNIKKSKKLFKEEKKKLKAAKGEYIQTGLNKARKELGIEEKRERLMGQNNEDTMANVNVIEDILDKQVYSKYRDRKNNDSDIITLQPVRNKADRQIMNYDNNNNGGWNRSAKDFYEPTLTKSKKKKKDKPKRDKSYDTQY